MTNEEYQKFLEEYGDISNYIKDKMDKYRNKEEDLQNEVKVIFFLYLLNKVNTDTFYNKMTNSINKLETSQNRAIKRHIKTINEVIDKRQELMNKSIPPISSDISEKDVKKILTKLDTTSVKKTRESYIKILKNYYDATLEIIKKDYILESEYLSTKVTQYDKIVKTVPYFKKGTNQIQSYHTFASYNAMVENFNLTRSALNRTIEQVGGLGNDLLYVVPHLYSCPLCIPYQGKVLSMTGKTKGYPSLEEAENNGLLHPNCSHEFVGYWSESQKQSNNYDSIDWEEKYKTKQKINAVNREIEKIKTDKVIYNKLNNQEKVDSCNSTLKKLYQKRSELKG